MSTKKGFFSILGQMDGAEIAFDNWTLSGYFANRMCTLSMMLIANFTAKAKAFFASLSPKMAFAPIAA